MKKLLLPLYFLMALLFTNSLHAQTNEDKLGLPGDNLNLYAALKLFQESATLEGFEKNLNDQNSKINNLDLDGDGKTDYIKVKDNVDGNVHNIVLQIDVNANEKQDVAVFTVQKDANNKVQVQVIGDEALYGKNYIIEPNMEDVPTTATGETPNPAYTGNSIEVEGQQVEVIPTTTAAIANWPIVEYVYLPQYSAWNSPWHWGYYPSYWTPWQPFFWDYYWGYHHNWNYWYYGHYRRWNYPRYDRYNQFYYSSRRSISPFYYQRRESGFYRTTYSRPDTRSQGEALYRKLYPNNNNHPIKPVPGNVVQPVNHPIKPIHPDVQPVDHPIKPLHPDVQPVDHPIKPIQPDVQPVDHPIKPIHPDVQPVDHPIKPIHPDVQPVDHPIRPIQPDIQPGNHPIRPIQPDIQPANHPIRPVRPDIQPDRPTTRPMNPVRERPVKSMRGPHVQKRKKTAEKHSSGKGGVNNGN